MPNKTSKPTKSPDKLARTGKAGVELSELQLGQAKGGLINKHKLDYK